MGAQPMGKPGWPLFAFSTPSMARKRIALMLLLISSSDTAGTATLAGAACARTRCAERLARCGRAAVGAKVDRAMAKQGKKRAYAARARARERAHVR